MIYIVHGEDITKSRNLILNQQKKIGIESRVEIDISQTSPEEFFSLIHNSGLFEEDQYIVLNISKAGRANLEPYVEKLNKIPTKIILIILSDKNLTSSNIFIKNANKLGAKIIFNQKIPLSNTFKFIDAVFYKQRDSSYQELSKLFKDQIDPLEIFSMVCWGLRNVANAKFGNNKYFSGKDFLKNKAANQSRLFTETEIKELFSAFSDLDLKSKTGGIETELLVPMAVEKVLNS